MITKTQTIVQLPNVTPSSLFKPDYIKGLVTNIENVARSFVFDTSTKSGIAECKSIAARVRSTKAALDEIGKSHKAVLSREAVEVDAMRRYIRCHLDNLAEEIRGPVTKLEEAEEERKTKHREALQEISDISSTEGVIHASERQLDEVYVPRYDKLITAEEGLTTAAWEEFLPEAEKLTFQGAATLGKAIAARRAALHQEAENEALRKQLAEQERISREQQIRIEAEERARSHFVASRAVAAHHEEVEATTDPVAPPVEPTVVKRYNAHAPLVSTQSETHEKLRNREILNAIVTHCNITEVAARQVVRCIVKGVLPHVTIITPNK